jgi:MFS family permease
MPPIIAASYFSPIVFGGLAVSIFTGILLDYVSGTLLMIFAGVASILAPILFLVRPDGGSYWIYIFPSMICAALGVYITFVVTTVIISRLSEIIDQGFVGALINSWYAISMAISLGFADIVASDYSWQSTSPHYRSVFWLSLAFAAFSMIITLIFVRIGKTDGS